MARSAESNIWRILMAVGSDADRTVPNWQIVDNIWNAHIRVDVVDPVYAEVRERGTPVDYTIYDAPSGFREFGVQDPDGHDIGIGQPIEVDRT